jgi:rhodanese-related sulfurtransferase
MPSTTEFTVSQLQRRVGLPDSPVLIDVRIPEDRAADPRRLPAALFHAHHDVSRWAASFAGKDVVVLCQKGLKLSQGSVAWLRHAGIAAHSLEGGFEAWRDTGGLLVNPVELPRSEQEQSVWVTRQRPKIDRIACPWLIRRFFDPAAVFLFVSPSEVQAVAERFAATPFDIEGVLFTHREATCTFDTMLDIFGLQSPVLTKMAEIIRAADTDRLETVPQAAGFLALSLGLSRMYRDDLAQLDAGMLLYDALFRWCRDATSETHHWPRINPAA